MRTQRFSNLTLGVFAVFLMLLAAYFVFTKRIPFVHGHRIDIVFSSSNQLITGSPVRVAGVDIGKVSKIRAGDQSTQIVTVELSDDGLPIHQDARARIRPRLFLEGGFMVEINPGSPSGPEIKDGGTIPLGQTAIPVQFHQILGAFNHRTRDNLRDVLSELDTALDGGGAQALGAAQKPLAPLLRDSAQIFEAARGRRPHDVSEGIRSTARITAALASRDADLRDLVTNLRVTTSAMAAEDANLSATVRNLDELLQDTPEALTALDASLPPLRRFAAALRPGLRVAPAALDQVSALLTQLYGATAARELPRTLALVDRSADNLPELTRRLTALFPLVQPVTDCVRDRAAPVLEAKLDDGHLSTNRPVWQDLLHLGVGLNSSQQSFDGNGFYTRYLTGVGEELIRTGDLQGFATQPIQGARPVWLGKGVPVPFRPDAKCTDQALPDLQARTSSPAMRSRHVERKPIKLSKFLASVKKAAKK